MGGHSKEVEKALVRLPDNLAEKDEPTSEEQVVEKVEQLLSKCITGIVSWEHDLLLIGETPEETLVILNAYGEQGWQAICMFGNKMLVKRIIPKSDKDDLSQQIDPE